MERQKLKKINITRWRLLWILIAAVWIFVILKMLVGALFEKNTSLVAAFSDTNPESLSATVEVTAVYEGGYMDSFDKQQKLLALAEVIQLELEGKPEITVTGNRQEISFTKEAKAADTELRTISIWENSEEWGEIKHYIYAKITLRESLEAVLTYKKLLEEAMSGLNYGEISTTIQLVGDYTGYLTLDRRDEITDEILDAIGAKVVYEHREKDLYTVYAYTAGLDNYITVENRKINVHIAISQDEENYRTILYLASPILPDTW